MFYNHLILSGTKMVWTSTEEHPEFYNHLILSGTKIEMTQTLVDDSFTIT